MLGNIKGLQRKTVPSRLKKEQIIIAKSLYSKTSCGVDYEKTASLNYLSKCS